MLCQNCNIHQATIHIQEIVNGEKKSVHLCVECAEKQSIDIPGFKELNLSEMLFNLTHDTFANDDADIHIHNSEESTDKPHVLTCPYCGWDGIKVKKNGRMGCPKCYDVFTKYISTLLVGMHKGMTHTGKVPFLHRNPSEMAMAKEFRNRSAIQNELASLKKKLNEAVGREDYETAAKLRDNITSMNNELANYMHGTEDK